MNETDLNKLRAAPGFWYLGTPYSRYPHGTQAAYVEACRVAAWLVQEGVAAFSPIAHTHGIAVHGGIDPLDGPKWLSVDRPMMEAASGLIVCRLESWEQSAGLAHEIKAFKEQGKPIVYMDWITAKRPDIATTADVSQPGGDPRFHAILREIAELHSRKARDYGAGADVFANVRASEAWGIPAWVGSMVRACDKVKRLQSFVENGSLACEGVEDSLLDLAAYAMISLVLYRELAHESP